MRRNEEVRSSTIPARKLHELTSKTATFTEVEYCESVETHLHDPPEYGWDFLHCPYPGPVQKTRLLVRLPVVLQQSPIIGVWGAPTWRFKGVEAPQNVSQIIPDWGNREHSAPATAVPPASKFRHLAISFQNRGTESKEKTRQARSGCVH
eukprot:1160119-Pelagomonas_calceolata.AAC.12